MINFIKSIQKIKNNY